MEASLFDMELDLLGSWDLTQLLTTAPDGFVSDQARGLVLPGLSSPDVPWSLVDPCGPSPVDEVQQDSLWLDPTDVVSGSPELFSGLLQADFSLQYKKLSTDFLFDDDSQALPLSSDLLLTSNHISSPISTLEASPIDVKFEFGDVHLDDQALYDLRDSSPRVIDNVFAQQTLPQFDHSTSFTPCRPEFILGSYEEDQILVDSYERDNIPLVVDSAVPTSPFTESCPSPLDSLEYDDDDSLHDAENVCQLLMALDGGDLHGTGSLQGTSLLSHVSPEEVESVFSRDSSSDDLVALCDASMALCDGSVARSNASCVSIELDFAVSSTSGFQVNRGSAISNAARQPIARSSTFSSASSMPIAQSSSVSSFTGSYSIANSTLPAVIVSEYNGANLINKIDSPRCASKSRTAPYGEVQIERRVRKKEQNKTAALRYRQKKREEKGHTMTEVEELEQQNQVLKNRADELSKEISYLRGLLEEITR